ncbi:MraZ-like protein [Phycisphaerae bacterium RAS1]|nr:MraZ-like protein [Phycisphaerae bacterium RAS1]
MAAFVGKFDLNIDEKSRMSVPAAVRKSLNDRIGTSLYATVGPRSGTLVLYPERVWEKLLARARASREKFREFPGGLLFVNSQSALLETDASGRALIPDRLLKANGIGREVTMVGNVDHLELWNRSDYEAFEKANYAAYHEKSASLHECFEELSKELMDEFTGPGDEARGRRE